MLEARKCIAGRLTCELRVRSELCHVERRGDRGRRHGAASANTDTRELLPKIEVPTLLIWGDADSRSPVAIAHLLHNAIPGARLAIIPGAGPVSNLEQRTLFDAEVRNFCLSASIP